MASENSSDFGNMPTHEEIAGRAHQIWEIHGRPSNTAEQDWIEAEAQLRAAAISATVTQKHSHPTGSVQA